MKKQILNLSQEANKKVYEKADFLIINLESEDIICTSTKKTINSNTDGGTIEKEQGGSAIENWN